MTKKDNEVNYSNLINKVIDSKRNIRKHKKQNIEKLKRLLKRYANEKKTITIEELANKMKVSKMTISRYLAELSDDDDDDDNIF